MHEQLYTYCTERSTYEQGFNYQYCKQLRKCASVCPCVHVCDSLPHYNEMLKAATLQAVAFGALTSHDDTGDTASGTVHVRC